MYCAIDNFLLTEIIYLCWRNRLSFSKANFCDVASHEN